MKEELKFYGNELVELQTVFTVATVVFQLPFAWLFPKVPLYILIPSMELIWGVFNLAQFRANSFGQEIAFRFMVGVFEVTYNDLLNPQRNKYTNRDTTVSVFPLHTIRARFLVPRRRDRTTWGLFLYRSDNWRHVDRPDNRFGCDNICRT